MTDVFLKYRKCGLLVKSIISRLKDKSLNIHTRVTKVVPLKSHESGDHIGTTFVYVALR